MHPIICTFGPFTVFSYGFMLVIAFLVSAFLMKEQAKKEGIDPETVFNLSFNVFVFGVIGARLFYIIENAGFYLRNPIEIIRLQSGGLSWFGGLFAGVIFAVIYLKKKKISLCKILDLAAPFLALGEAIGRIGCLLNGCCYGKVSNFGLFFDVHGQTLIPTQIYSSILLLAIFVILRRSQDKPHLQGQIFYSYLLLYSIKRFSIEFLRQDNPPVFFGLTLFHLISAAIFIFALVKLLKIKK